MRLGSLRRSTTILKPDSSRVLVRPHVPGGADRRSRIISRLVCLDEERVRSLAARVFDRFERRHPQYREVLEQVFGMVARALPDDRPVSKDLKLLIAAAFAQEYALEAAALFNPSIVPHPDQSGMPAGHLRFVLSLRATGEGHVSSLVFREGEISPDGEIHVYRPSPFVMEGRKEPNPSFDTRLFREKLGEIGQWNKTAAVLLEGLGPTFSQRELEGALRDAERRDRDLSEKARRTIGHMRKLLYSHYEVVFPSDQPISEQALYPSGPAERVGIEDARFVNFAEEDGRRVYYAVYTAFDGESMLPSLLQTSDFRRFVVSTLNGPEVENKGMALFPRRIGERYVMVGRQDNENLYLMFSQHLLFWHEKALLLRPTFPWECVQIGNCGAPLETDRGWLLFTHGVGPMRTYSIGAVLLDRDDPARVLGRTPEPLIEPLSSEHDAYVPNVVYSCGGLIHREHVVLPYAMSDYSTTFAVFDLAELLDLLERCGPHGLGCEDQTDRSVNGGSV